MSPAVVPVQLMMAQVNDGIGVIAGVFPMSGNAFSGEELQHGGTSCGRLFRGGRTPGVRPRTVEIGVYYEGKETLREGITVVRDTPYGRPANVNNSASPQIFLTYKRTSEPAPWCGQLAVVDVCVIVRSKGELPPHTYYCLAEKNLNRGYLGSDVFLCYKKTLNRPRSLTYQPSLLSRYPAIDLGCPLPDSVAMFCLPLGASLERWGDLDSPFPPPMFSTFVLTVSQAAEKMYGAGLSFYESVDLNSLTPVQSRALFGSDLGSRPTSVEKETSLTAQTSSTCSSPLPPPPGSPNPPGPRRVVRSKCICLLSRFPFFEAFERFLRFLHRLTHASQYSSSNQEESLSTSKISVEQFLHHFLFQIPFPSPTRPTVWVQLTPASDWVFFTDPHVSPLPLSGASFQELLKNLDVETFLLVFLFVMTEQKILLHSHRPDVLTSVAEALTMTIFPLSWQCPYIPSCPLSLTNVLSAPMALIVGVDSRFFDYYDPPDDVICVDLDAGHLKVPLSRQWMTPKFLPKKPAKALKTKLSNLRVRCFALLRDQLALPEPTDANPEAHLRYTRKERRLEVEIQEAFLLFMASILKNYGAYLTPITSAPGETATDFRKLFNEREFLLAQDKACLNFYSVLTKTQLFIRFIEERTFASSAVDSSLAFFDEICDKFWQQQYPNMTPSVVASPGGGGASDGSSHHSEVDSTISMTSTSSGSSQPSGFLLESSTATSERTVFILPPEPASSSRKTSSSAPEDPMASPSRTEFQYDAFPDTFETEHFPEIPAGILAANMNCSTLMPPGQPLGQSRGSSVGLPFRLSRRTRHEMKAANLAAKRHHDNPLSWAKCLLSTGYSLWFLHLPAYFQSLTNHRAAIHEAAQVLTKMHSLRLSIDEVCYRTLIQLCGNYSLPVMAVQILTQMQERGYRPNAYTYGYYNKAVLEAAWPTRSLQFWKKLRYVILGAAEFRRMGQKRQARRRSVSTASPESEVDGLVMKPIGGSKSGDEDSLHSREEDDKKEAESNAANVRRNLFPVRRGFSFGEIPFETKMEDMFTRPRQRRQSDTSYLVKQGSRRPVPPKPKSRRSKSLSPTDSDQLAEGVRRFYEEGTPRGETSESATPSRGGSGEGRGSVSPSPPSCRSQRDSATPSSSVPRSPARTPVIENDPLGALGSSASSVPSKLTTESEARSSSSSSAGVGPKHSFQLSWGNLRRSMKSSTTSSNRATRGSTDSSGSFKESELGVPGGGMARTEHSAPPDPTAFSSPKENLLQGWKSATHSLAKKWDYFREVVSASNTPQRPSPAISIQQSSSGVSNSHASSPDLRFNNTNGQVPSERRPDSHHLSLPRTDTDRSFTESVMDRLRQAGWASSTERLSTVASTSVLEMNSSYQHPTQPPASPAPAFPESMYPPEGAVFPNKADMALRVTLTSCTPCSQCSNILFDEEIMSRWSAEDADFSTRCCVCNKGQATILSVAIEDWRKLPKPVPLLAVDEGSPLPTTSVEIPPGHADGDPVVTTLNVPYLSPLVLRRELERVLDAEGDQGVSLESEFAKEHDIVYWNLVWYFTRIRLPSHLPQMAFGVSEVEESELHADWQAIPPNQDNLCLRCTWDNPALFGARRPLYRQWKKGTIDVDDVDAVAAHNTSQQILAGIRCNDIKQPLRALLSDSKGKPRLSLYREVLFLCFVGLGRENIDPSAFDRQYKKAAVDRSFFDIPLAAEDQAPNVTACFCRKAFAGLALA
ncbi:unnamed protein product [Cyprideis torosa]|uniref:Uncharacterized protein n=1 Tax=Cyprideis torosa TaxID=163714 RepID=A0A7R8W6C7_9CRUS|nr:unnamed protein product [Cyprideis torosa]CAG0885100.1 unnamed protein product [Cyprideis torosa]